MENNLKDENTKCQMNNETIRDKKKVIMMNAVKQELKVQKSQFDDVCNNTWPYFIALYVLSIIGACVIEVIFDKGPEFSRLVPCYITLIVLGFFIATFWVYALIIAFAKGIETLSNGEK